MKYLYTVEFLERESEHLLQHIASVNKQTDDLEKRLAELREDRRVSQVAVSEIEHALADLRHGGAK